MKLRLNETIIVGKWTFEKGQMLADENCKRIEWLLEHSLVKISSTEGGWTTIYESPDDGCYWQLTYPNGEMQGGGPPMLKRVGTSLS